MISGDEFENVKLTCKVTRAGDRSPGTVTTTLQRKSKTMPWQVVKFTSFGLIDVRTGGKRILFAARNEKDGSQNTEEMRGRL